jgi:sulfur carrier protein
MRIEVNGEARDVPDGLNVAGLLAHLELNPGRVAIERSLQILPRAAWPGTAVALGDRFEIVHFVGGGSVVINAAGEYAFRDVLRYAELTVIRRRFARTLLIAFGLFLVAVFLLVAVARPARLREVWPGAIVGIALVSVPLLLPRFAANALWNATPEWRGRQEFEFDGDGVNVGWPQGRSRILWKGFTSWREDPSSFYLFVSAGRGLIVPKRFLGAAANADALREVLSLHIRSAP